jgi:hypothetical protein
MPTETPLAEEEAVADVAYSVCPLLAVTVPLPVIVLVIRVPEGTVLKSISI